MIPGSKGHKSDASLLAGGFDVSFARILKSHQNADYFYNFILILMTSNFKL